MMSDTKKNERKRHYNTSDESDRRCKTKSKEEKRKYDDKSKDENDFSRPKHRDKDQHRVSGGSRDKSKERKRMYTIKDRNRNKIKEKKGDESSESSSSSSSSSSDGDESSESSSSSSSSSSDDSSAESDESYTSTEESDTSTEESDSSKSKKFANKNLNMHRRTDTSSSSSTSKNREKSVDREKVREKNREKSVDREKVREKNREKSVDREKVRERNREKSVDREKVRERNREKSVDREKVRERNREKSVDREKVREKNREKSVDREKVRERNREKSVDREKVREKNREKSVDRETVREKNRDKSRDKETVREKNRDKSRDKEKEQDKSIDRGKESGKSRENCYRDRYRERERSRYRDRNRYEKISYTSYYGTRLNTYDSKRNHTRNLTNVDRTNEKCKDETVTSKEKKTVDLLTKTGGAYIPPAKLRLMQQDIDDKTGEAFQRISWEALKKSIHGYINKVNTSNIGLITRDLLKENIVRGRGLLVRSIIQAQAAALTFTPVYAALVAVINSKFPNIGELLIKRVALRFKYGIRRNDKTLCISSAIFIAHLVNQGVSHEILILEILTLLVMEPTDDSIEVAIAVLKECGMRLTQISRKAIEAIFEMLRNILHEGQLDKRVQYMIEVMFQIRKDGFKDYEIMSKDLDLVEEEDQLIHLVVLDDPIDGENILNVFKYDPEFDKNEQKYQELIKEILETDSDTAEGEDDDEDGEEDSDENSDTEEAKDGGVIIDNTETNLTALRRTIYLTIHSSLDFEECAHKLMKMQLKPGQEIELCHMILDCCAEMRTYEKFFGLLAGRFCSINKKFVECFQQIFADSYDTIHRLDTNRLRNVSKFFGHLLITDSISWGVLSTIKMNEKDSTSSNRVFVKILFQELSEYLGLPKLNEKLKNEELEGLFPKDSPENTRFSINFFTCIGLGGLTDDLREHLKSRPKTAVIEEKKSSTSDSSSSSSSSTSSSSDSDASRTTKKRKKKGKKHKNEKNKKFLQDDKKEKKKKKN